MLVPLLAAVAGIAEVVVLARRPGLDVLEYCGTRCMNFEGGGWHRLFEEGPGPGTALDPDGVSRVLAFLSDPSGRVRSNLARFFPGAGHWVFPGRPREGDAVHAALYLARCAARTGIRVDPEAAVAKALEKPLLSGCKGGREQGGIILHPGSGGTRKNFSPEFWMALMDRLSGVGERAGSGDVTWLLGPAEEGLRSWFQERIFGARARVVFSPDMRTLVSMLGRAALYGGHDSGVTHLAAMLGTPTAALFKDTDPAVWRPLGPRVNVIRARNEGRWLLEQALRASMRLINDFLRRELS